MESWKHPSTGMIIGIIAAIVIVLIIIGIIWWAASQKTDVIVPVATPGAGVLNTAGTQYVPVQVGATQGGQVGASRVTAPSRKANANFRQILGRKG